MSKKEKRFICIGEKIKNGIKQGMCGDIHSLQEWIDIVFGEKAKGFFNNETESYILRYILENGGKRLKEEGK